MLPFFGNTQKTSLLYVLVSYFVFSLSLPPHLQNSHGMGAMAKVQKASKLVAHPTPSPRYNCKANSGNAAETAYRLIIAAAAAEAPYLVVEGQHNIFGKYRL